MFEFKFVGMSIPNKSSIKDEKFKEKGFVWNRKHIWRRTIQG